MILILFRCAPAKRAGQNAPPRQPGQHDGAKALTLLTPPRYQPLPARSRAQGFKGFKRGFSMSITTKIVAVSMAALTMGAVMTSGTEAQARGWGLGLGVGLATAAA